MLLSLTTVVTTLHEGTLADGTQLVVRLADRMAIFCHALVLPALFGLTTEVSGPLWQRLRNCLAAILVGHADAEIHAFPRAASGYWG